MTWFASFLVSLPAHLVDAALLFHIFGVFGLALLDS